MTVFIVELEPIDTRYTVQWAEHIPKSLEDRGLDVIRIKGDKHQPPITPGAFLNFSGTNAWKSQQLESISWLFSNDSVDDGDYFLYTDAWNPTVIQLKYMAELLGIKIRIGGLWHAGSYDPQDFLGRLIGNKPWVRHAEKSMYHCYDDNFFATHFHVQLFFDELMNNGMKEENPWYHEDLAEIYDGGKISRVGWPMDYLDNELKPYRNLKKENIVLFPHRIAPEKQVEIFRDLAESFPDYQFIVCQDTRLTKHEYHTLLGKAKMVFSANLQETLGISCYEGTITGAFPMVPERLSYKEMYGIYFTYPSVWTESFESYKKHKTFVISYMRTILDNYEEYTGQIYGLRETLKTDYFSGDKLYNIIKEHHE